MVLIVVKRKRFGLKAMLSGTRYFVIGGAGNVGKGIAAALQREGRSVAIIDPSVNSTWQGLDNDSFAEKFKGATVIHAADVGNRDLYVSDPNLAERQREELYELVSRLVICVGEPPLWYIGGSWTRLQWDDSFEITDTSPSKLWDSQVPYEQAKSLAKKCATELSELFPIRFVDYISIAPNLSDNFSICRMVREGVTSGTVTYSPLPYGRPLLTSEDAGHALVTLMTSDDTESRFHRYWIPGAFVPFRDFAFAVRDVLRECGREVTLLEQTETPDSLKVTTRSEYLTSLGFTPHVQELQNQLRENARLYYNLLFSTSSSY